MKRSSENVSFFDLSCSLLQFAGSMLVKRFQGNKTNYQEKADLNAIHKIMVDYWKGQNLNESTIKYFLRDAFQYDSYDDVIERVKRVWGPLQGKRVLDLGCGWGGLSVALSRDDKMDLTFSDRVPEHVDVARRRVPDGRGFVGDASALTENGENLSEPFDIVFLHSLIEHVGNPENHHGDASSSMEAKQNVLHTAWRLLKPGGKSFLSTGNFLFPFDGEIKTWFFHWLPPIEQQKFLKIMGFEADRYGLLRWKEMEQMCRIAGFEIERVESVDPKSVTMLLKLVSFVSRPRNSLPRFEIEQLDRLMKTDPNFMPNWFVFLKKAGNRVSH